MRPRELRVVELAEINLDAAEWCVPGAQMKMKIDHTVSLSRQAVELLPNSQSTPDYTAWPTIPVNHAYCDGGRHEHYRSPE